MRDTIERLVVLPFTVAIGCASDSSLSLGSKCPKQEANSPLTRKREKKRSNKSQVKDLLGLLPSKCSISYGIRRLIRSIKKISQMFAYKEEIVIEIEKEMEIGHPTDVKHVTHIGLDGSTTTNPIKSWNNNVNAPEILSFRPTISLKQFEQAMAAQTQNHQC